jgi:hypothetical protein
VAVESVVSLDLPFFISLDYARSRAKETVSGPA